METPNTTDILSSVVTITIALFILSSLNVIYAKLCSVLRSLKISFRYASWDCEIPGVCSPPEDYCFIIEVEHLFLIMYWCGFELITTAPTYKISSSPM